MILAWLILNPLRFLACEALMILIVRTSFMSFRLTGSRIDLGLPEPIGVTRINCLIFRFPLHVILRTFIVLLSADATWICCCFGVFSETKGFISRYICRYFQRDLISPRNRTLSGIFLEPLSHRACQFQIDIPITAQTSVQIMRQFRICWTLAFTNGWARRENVFSCWEREKIAFATAQA